MLLDILAPLLIAAPIAAFLCLIALVVTFDRREIASCEEVGVRHADHSLLQTCGNPGSARILPPGYASAPGASLERAS